jgi:hypothetical protein
VRPRGLEPSVATIVDPVEAVHQSVEAQPIADVAYSGQMSVESWE